MANQLTNKPFRDRLQLAREQAGLNRSELGRRLQVSPQAVHAWEVGVNIPRPKRIEQIARAIGVNPAWLAYGEGQMDLKAAPPSAPPIPGTPSTPLTGLLRPHARPEVRESAIQWVDRMAAALPPPLRQYVGPRLPAPWPRLDYLSPSLAVEVKLVSASTDSGFLVDRLYRRLTQLLIVGRLAAVSSAERRLLLILADIEGVGLPSVPSRLAWEAQTLGVEIATVRTPEQAAQAILAAEAPPEPA